MSKPNPKEISDNVIRMMTSAHGYSFKSIIELARTEAELSDLKNFKTGAVLFSLTKDDVEPVTGCSKKTSDGSIHAEQMSLHDLDVVARSKSSFYKPHYDSCFIFTLNKSNNIANSSKPCAHCVRLLYVNEVKYVFYPIVEDGVVKIVSASVADLYDASSHIKKSKYAKLMRF